MKDLFSTSQMEAHLLKKMLRQLCQLCLKDQVPISKNIMILIGAGVDLKVRQATNLGGGEERRRRCVHTSGVYVYTVACKTCLNVVIGEFSNL